MRLQHRVKFLEAKRPKHSVAPPDPALVKEIAAALVGDTYQPATLKRYGFNYPLESNPCR